MGKIIVQNNHPNGFHVILSSEHLGQIAAISDLDGETDIEYKSLLNNFWSNWRWYNT